MTRGFKQSGRTPYLILSAFQSLIFTVMLRPIGIQRTKGSLLHLRNCVLTDLFFE